MNNPTLEVNSTVAIISDNDLVGYRGVVMDTASDMEPEDGPIAVFFDAEVPDSFFLNLKCEQVALPTPDNYQENHRVVCFEPEEVKVV